MRGSYPIARLLADLVRVARRAKKSNQILASGHIRLSWYLSRGLCRPTDRAFTVIREPRASLMSLLNYYIRRFQQDPDGKATDTGIWEKFITVPRIGAEADAETLREFGKSILPVEALTRHTFATTMLGAGTYASAMDLIIRSNVELVPLEAYNAWLSEEWDINSTARANASPQVLRLEDFNKPQLSYMDDLLADDYKLHERIVAAWRKKGGTRIFGSDLLSN